MLRVLYCVTQDHDYRLVLLAALVCGLGSHAAISLLGHVREARGRARLGWLVVTAVAIGVAIWTTHFIAMLAYSPGGTKGYDLLPTVGSLLLAILLTGLSCRVAVGARLPYARPLGGALVGLSIAAMHYLGMAALEVAGALAWELRLVLASLLLGSGFGACALQVGLGPRSWARVLGGALLLTLAICSLHFTAMAAVTIHPDPTIVPPAAVLPPERLAVAVAIAGSVVLALSLVGLALDRRDQRRLARHDAHMRELADLAVEGLAICDGDDIVAANKSLEAMAGRASAEIVGLQLGDVLADAELVARLRAGQEALVEGELVTASGERVPVELVGRAITYAGRPHRVVAFRDLRARRQAEAKIRFLAYHDVLTELPNRASFNSRLEHECLQRKRTGAAFAVLSVDLDRFKVVNDTLGHPVGDALLEEVADRLRSATRDTDFVARLGGDEFAILQTSGTQPAAATRLAERIVDLIDRPFVIEGHAVNVGASVGIALAPADGDDPGQLLKNADLALYRAKLDGRGTFSFFEPGMDARMQERRALELDLRRALARGEFELHYQPQLGLQADALVGFEALLRWRHPERGLVPPGDFIPLAEEIGLIVPIGDWVVQAACREAAGWSRPLSVAINLSPAQFRDGRIVETVRAALDRTGLSPGRLELEITETALLQDDAATLATLHRLRELGVRISMDDFGTGYSSLNYLRRFPFSKIKIDRSFIGGLGGDEESVAIVSAILALGRSLGIATTAEGVETTNQLDRLRAEGCNEAQGFLISRPLPAAEIGALLQGRVEAAA